MLNLARKEFFFGRFPSIDEMVQCIEEVSADQIQIIAQEFFAGKQVGLTVLGRFDSVSFIPEELIC